MARKTPPLLASPIGVNPHAADSVQNSFDIAIAAKKSLSPIGSAMDRTVVLAGD